MDIAEQLERVVALMNDHPLAFLGAVVAILLVLGFQKDGLFSRVLSLLEKRAILDGGKEERRLEILRMLEGRRQLELPMEVEQKKLTHEHDEESKS